MGSRNEVEEVWEMKNREKYSERSVESRIEKGRTGYKAE